MWAVVRRESDSIENAAITEAGLGIHLNIFVTVGWAVLLQVIYIFISVGNTVPIRIFFLVVLGSAHVTKM